MIPICVAAVSEIIEDGPHLVVGDVEPHHVQHVLHLVQGDVVLPRQDLIALNKYEDGMTTVP